MKLLDVYCYSTFDHRIPVDEVASLGPVVPEFYRILAGTYGCGTLSHFFDIHRPRWLRELTESTLAQSDEFDWAFRDTLKSAYVVGHGLLGDYWYLPANDELFILRDLEALVRMDSEVAAVFRHIEEGAARERLVFHPFERRQRFRFAHPEHEASAISPGQFDETVRWFREAGLHDYSETDGSPTDINRSATLYFPEFGGDLYICQGGGGVSLTLGIDRGIDSSRLQRLLWHAESAGWLPGPHPHDH